MPVTVSNCYRSHTGRHKVQAVPQWTTKRLIPITHALLSQSGGTKSYARFHASAQRGQVYGP